MGKRSAITDARVGAFKAPPGREAVLWDGVVPGLGVRALPTSGRKTWIVHRRVGSAVAKRTLAAPDAISVEEARRAVQALIEEVEGDAGAPASVPTIRAFGPSFLADCAGRWKPTTRAAHAHNMQRSILPAFGICRVDTITARDVRSWFDDLSVTREETANRSPAVLSSLMKHAEARKAEALGLRWEYVHGDRIVLPDSKSGPRAVWLATPARAVLGALPRRDGCPWVFASDDATPVSLVKPWQVIRRKAGLGRLRHHDLRQYSGLRFIPERFRAVH